VYSLQRLGVITSDRRTRHVTPASVGQVCLDLGPRQIGRRYGAGARRHAITVAAIACVFVGWGAPSVTQFDSSQTAGAFFAALQRTEWDTAAKLVDHDWLASFREDQLPMLVPFAEMSASGKPVGNSSLRSVPADSQTVRRLLTQFGNVVVRGVPGVGTLGQLAQLPPSRFFASFLQAQSQVLASATPPGGKRPSWRVIGVVRESDSLAHVVYRYEGPSLVKSKHQGGVSMFQVQRRGRDWYCVPGPEFAEPAFGVLLASLGSL